MSGEHFPYSQADDLKPVQYNEGIADLTSVSLVEAQSAAFTYVKRSPKGDPVPWRKGQQPSGNELWDLARAMIGLPLDLRVGQVEQGRRIGLARRMARMPLGDEVDVVPGKKKPRNAGDSTQAAHEAGIAQAPAEAIAKYAHRYGVTIEWLVTGNYLGYQNGIALSSVFIRLSQGHADGFFMHGCFPDRRRWRLDRAYFLRDGYRVVSPEWLDPWLVCAKFLGKMHRSDDDPEYKRNSIMKDAVESLKSIARELRFLQPRDPIPPEVVPDAE